MESLYSAYLNDDLMDNNNNNNNIIRVSVYIIVIDLRQSQRSRRHYCGTYRWIPVPQSSGTRPFDLNLSHVGVILYGDTMR